MRKRALFLLWHKIALGFLVWHSSSYGLVVSPLPDWDKIEEKAKDQAVYFHAWGGSPEVNQYLQWVKAEVKKRYGVSFYHVKISDSSESIQRLLTEKVAGKTKNGSIDLMWVNGENFAALKQQHLLFGPFVKTLPHWSLVDKKLPVEVDFSTPTEGLEAPWGVGQLILIYDQKTLKNPPENFSELLSYAKNHPNRLSYPKPPEFHGVSFLKSLLISLSGNDPLLQRPVDELNYKKITTPLWGYIDEFHKVAWRKGKQFPAGSAETLQLLDDGELDLAISFNPNAVRAAQNSGQLSETTKAYALSIGALTNIHFLAIPHNANAKEGALVTINFLLSPEAQSKKGDPDLWGDPSVLEAQHLKGAAKQNRLFPAISEIHPSWQLAIEQDWLKRYGH